MHLGGTASNPRHAMLPEHSFTLHVDAFVAEWSACVRVGGQKSEPKWIVLSGACPHKAGDITLIGLVDRHACMFRLCPWNNGMPECRSLAVRPFPACYKLRLSQNGPAWPARQASSCRTAGDWRRPGSSGHVELILVLVLILGSLVLFMKVRRQRELMITILLVLGAATVSSFCSCAPSA
jgi:hypothetical protein